MDFGNTCALICRFVLLILLLYGIVLSSMVVSSCHMINAVTHDDETHGVGLQTFEDESGNCVPHNTFVVNNYNGMEMAAKVGGYVAPTLASLVVLWCLLECCKQGGCWGGKCIPMILLLGATVCQGLTFMLFQSDLFCSNKDIASCQMGDAGWRSMQACFVYLICLILYKIGPTPVPFAPPANMNMTKARPQPKASASSSSKKSNSSSKKTAPGKGEDWTKEMYAQRRKEKKAKSRGVSGRSKQEIFDDLKGGGREGKEGSYENSLALYEPGKGDRRSRRSQPQYDDYVDTEPDGMDWSAYTPNEREAYYERKRSKKRERMERDRHRDYDDRAHRGSRGSRDDSYYDNSYNGSGRYDESYRRGDSYYSDRDRGYEMTHYDDGRGGRRDDYGDYSVSGSRGDGRDREYRGGGGQDDYSYRQDDYSYTQQDYGNDPPDQNDIYYGESHSRGGSTRRSGSRGSDRGGRSYGGSYDYNESYDDYERRGGYRDDPSFA